MRSVVAALGVVVVLGVACGPVPGDPPLDAPLNRCTTSADCAAYTDRVQPTCTGGACVQLGVEVPASSVLVITMPATAAVAPNRTLAIPFSKAFQSNPKCPSGGFCVVLPNVQLVTQVYLPDPVVVRDEVKFYLGEDERTIIPSRAMFYPQWRLDDDTLVDARMVGLPLDPIPTEPSSQVQDYVGPDGKPAIGFQTRLQVEVPHERIILPLPPFDRAYPPDVDAYLPEQPGASSPLAVWLMAVDKTGIERALPTFTAQGVPPTGSFDGWTMYLRHVDTKRRISSLAVLSGENPTVQLNTSYHPPNGEAMSAAELVLEPPPGEPVPTYVVDETTSKTDPDYPPIYPNARVSGTVTSVGERREAVPADLVLTSTRLYGPDLAKQPLLLSYRVTTRTQRDALGRETWALDLPPGEYEVAVTPRVPGYAKSLRTVIVDASTPEQAGKDLAVELPVRMEGICVLSDGRPLADAEVEARPASTLRATTPAIPEHRWPRVLTTRTDVDGHFVLDLDRLEQARYDLFVRPADGSRFPWYVRSGVIPAAGNIGRITIPTPITAGSTIVDSSFNLVPRAVVRFFALPSGAVAPSIANGVAYVEIGRTITDARGRYEMYLAPPE